MGGPDALITGCDGRVLAPTSGHLLSTFAKKAEVKLRREVQAEHHHSNLHVVGNQKDKGIHRVKGAMHG